MESKKNELETKQYELQLLLRNIPTIGEIDLKVAEEMQVSINMINKVKSGVRWQDRPDKLNDVIKAYRKEFNEINNKIQK